MRAASHSRFLPLSPTSYMAHSRKRQKPFPVAQVYIQSTPISCPDDGDHFTLSHLSASDEATY